MMARMAHCRFNQQPQDMSLARRLEGTRGFQRDGYTELGSWSTVGLWLTCKPTSQNLQLTPEPDFILVRKIMGARLHLLWPMHSEVAHEDCPLT